VALLAHVAVARKLTVILHRMWIDVRSSAGALRQPPHEQINLEVRVLR
jgi:hypothetical protein